LNRRWLQHIKSGKKRPFLSGPFTAFCLIVCVCFSCGIEDYIYLDAVERVPDSTVNGAQFVLPNSSTSIYFRNYAIYYRIYLSDYNTAVNTITTSTERNKINTALNSHYNTIDPYITNENTLPGDIDNIFERLKYYPLYVSLNKTNEIDLANLFSISGTGTLPGVSPGGTVYLYFTDPDIGPYMTLYAPSATPLYLLRSNSANPLPNSTIGDRLFFLDTSFDNNNITADYNYDVEKPISNYSTKTAYVSMYILAVGIDYNYSPVYSRPLHLGIFKLGRFWF